MRKRRYLMHQTFAAVWNVHFFRRTRLSSEIEELVGTILHHVWKRVQAKYNTKSRRERVFRNIVNETISEVGCFASPMATNFDRHVRKWFRRSKIILKRDSKPYATVWHEKCDLVSWFIPLTKQFLLVLSRLLSFWYHPRNQSALIEDLARHLKLSTRYHWMMGIQLNSHLVEFVLFQMIADLILLNRFYVNSFLYSVMALGQTCHLLIATKKLS